VNLWLAPLFTDTLPDGVMLPFEPALAVMVYDVFAAKLAEMVWSAVILLNG
jgi:hypothetical protein